MKTNGCDASVGDNILLGVASVGDIISNWKTNCLVLVFVFVIILVGRRQK